MSVVIYREKRSLKHYISLREFIESIGLILTQYRLPSGYWRDDYNDRDTNGNLRGFRRIYGDQQSTYLEHYARETDNSDGYSGDGGVEFLKSYNLITWATREQMELEIKISRNLYTNDEIELCFVGAATEIEKLKQAVKPLLEKHSL